MTPSPTTPISTERIPLRHIVRPSPPHLQVLLDVGDVAFEAVGARREATDELSKHAEPFGVRFGRRSVAYQSPSERRK